VFGYDIQSEKGMDAVGVCRWVGIEAADLQPAFASKPRFLCEFTTSSLLDTIIAGLDPSARKLQDRYPGCMSILSY